jgi:hypothetical protein
MVVQMHGSMNWKVNGTNFKDMKTSLLERVFFSTYAHVTILLNNVNIDCIWWNEVDFNFKFYHHYPNTKQRSLRIAWVAS